MQFGSLLSYGLAHVQSKVLFPYQVSASSAHDVEAFRANILKIIFLFCGLLTVVFSVVVLLVLPDSPMQARFLKGDDKLLAIGTWY